ncbi:MAG: riboflavin biosynthesis protein RibD [Bacteroidetes bacterium 46-16]|nr:MAG: riboflavin biosynthesis protein RibD [Bacteroidetes bacterium 46-16]
MQDELFVKRCIELAARAKGYTAPNPMVGALLLYEDRIIGEGWHEQYGGPHAEVNCLESVKEEDRKYIAQSTMYVNLEPCAHHGKTPPCAVRLVAEKVKKVVIANTDPFERVQGEGVRILEQGGVDVISGIAAQEGAWLNRRFFTFHTRKRPYIILKWAQTQDGYFAPADRSRLQVSNERSMQLVHKWRTEEAAIMVGFNTALNDNPQLTARLWEGRQPLRIVLDKKLQIPATHHVFDATAATWIINEQKERLEKNVQWKQMQFGDDLLHDLLSALYGERVLSLIIEGGAKLLSSFIEKGLWDEARVFTGNVSLQDGIAAPLLTSSEPAFETNISGDTLSIYTNKNNPYSYVPGMEL